MLARHRSSHTPPALTLLECVFAVVLLSLVAMSVMSALSYATAEQSIGQQKLGAYEVANRLVLQWLDDQDAMPDRNRVIEWGPYVYAWEMKKDRVTMEVNDPRQLQAADDNAAVPLPAGNELQGLSRFQLIEIAVYPADRQTGQKLSLEPVAVLTRMYDPFATRNADAISRLDENDVSRMIQELTGQNITIPTTPPAGGGGNTSGGGGR